MIIDAHQHFWRLSRGDYSFPVPQDVVLYRDFEPSQLKPLLDQSGVSTTFLVQATDTLEETGFLLRLAAETPFVAGVVGWWDPQIDGGLSRLMALPHAEWLVGVRPMLQKYDDIAWLRTDDALQGLSEIGSRGLAFDALVDARHLDGIDAMCSALPELRVVIDHMGKPWRHPALFARWEAGMQALARHANCFVKLSGYPFAHPAPDPQADLPALCTRLRRWYGAERIIWGSDWPVAEREGGYASTLAGMKALVAADEQQSIFHDNAAAFYRLRQNEKS
ncbi:MAG TPA: amidohydrolase family protein [Kaistia sp.]|nr:amidohydrolase family protein [Kaistia sp.]